MVFQFFEYKRVWSACWLDTRRLGQRLPAGDVEAGGYRIGRSLSRISLDDTQHDLRGQERNRQRTLHYCAQSVRLSAMTPVAAGAAAASGSQLIGCPTRMRWPLQGLIWKSSGASNNSTTVEPNLNSPKSSPLAMGTPSCIGPRYASLWRCW